ncbi:MAG: glycerol-3-phosphate dehydrogenase [Sphingomonadaceae bacterium]|jgi:glycerol-3-phosphate dehydrogenase
MKATCDLLVIGGGINGTAIARAAAVAGRKVILVERDDLAQGTSSASTKLMHGGLRYLENYEFRLVHESLTERGIMLETARHLVHPLEFRIVHSAEMRPWLVMRLGLWLYDILAWRGTLPRSRAIRLEDKALLNMGGRGFSYWDARVDDARLVVANALDAASCGATILTQTRFLGAERRGDIWAARLATPKGEQEVEAAMIVNAAGPWAEQLLSAGFTSQAASRLRLVKGSHIVVDRCFAGEHAWLLQQPDGRIVFAIPYQSDYTLIGTTDEPVDDPADAHISDAETEYLLGAVNRYRREPLTRETIRHSFAGIRALYDDGAGSASAVSRDYHLQLDTAGPPLLSVFGGKITTARHLADDVMARLGIKGGDTRQRPLPGGDFSTLNELLDTARHRWPFLTEDILERMSYAYGTRIALVLGNARSLSDLGQDFGMGLYAREVDYLIAHEWALSAEDIVWRRTKLGLRMSASQVEVLDAYIGEKRG